MHSAQYVFLFTCLFIYILFFPILSLLYHYKTSTTETRRSLITSKSVGNDQVQIVAHILSYISLIPRPIYFPFLWSSSTYRIHIIKVILSFLTRFVTCTPKMSKSLWKLSLNMLQQLHGFMYATHDRSEAAARIYYKLTMDNKTDATDGRQLDRR